ncbi:UvrD-helicase domain-containing protein [Negadavirga shengliensis]|uniref:DNA 3'-5' helicase n=1 Tax=Negadavirga shengliensis TaxID=1389218 RepID=A0ABV9T4D4_9BACT
MFHTPFVIYKSSAGSGKTYTLTTEYLKLALENPAAFRHILAVTFTNKATREMKERILKEMVRLTASVDGREQMDSVLLKHLGGEPADLSSRAQKTLSALLHDYSAFSISTIDSFFQRVIRAFAKEIDLQAKFDIELDQNSVMDRLVDRLLLRVIDDSYLHKWLVDFASQQIQDGKSWDVRRNIKALGNQLFQENFKRYQSEIKTLLKDPENIKILHQHIHIQRQAILKQTAALREQANIIREKHGLVWEDFRGGKGSFACKFDKLGDPKNPLPSLTPNQKKMPWDSTLWYAKSSKKVAAIEAAFSEGLGGILGQFEPLTVLWNTLTALRNNFYVFGIFRYLLEELSDLKEEENILLISDANDFLREITAENDAPFIYEKVGTRFRHYLLDEFQDTSGFQWASFRPLLLNALSQGNRNLLVGDVKQSIYRWRGGEMRLLMEKVEEETSHFGVEVKRLDTNFRSLPNIIEFNNTLFDVLPGLMESVLSVDYQIEDTELIAKAYADVKQALSPLKEKSSFKGRVRLEFLKESEDEEDDGLGFKDRALLKLPGMVREMQDRGYRLKDLAFLVRNNSEGAEIADALMAYRQQHPDDGYRYDVLSDEAMYLNRAAVVRCLLAALQVLNDREDQVASKSLWIQWSRVHNREFGHDLFKQEGVPETIQAYHNAFESMKHVLLQLPLLDLVESVTAVLGLEKIERERAYLSGFKEAVYDFMKNNRTDLSSFLNWWKQNGEKRTVKIPDDHDAIRILTIHKSKGLQFKVVLAPFLDWKIFDTSKDNILWAPYYLEKPGLQAIFPISLRKDLNDSAFKSIYLEEALLAHLDTLNLLYVAFTRAEEVFFGISPFRDRNNKNNTGLGTVAAVLLEALENASASDNGSFLSEHYDMENHLFELGEWAGAPEADVHENIEVPLRWDHRQWQQVLKVKHVVGDMEAKDRYNRRSRGILIHAVIEKAKTKAQILSQMAALYFDGAIDGEEKKELEGYFYTLAAIPTFSSWFDDKAEVLTEQGIMLPGGERKRPDRIVFFDDRVEVVDFKTGEEGKDHIHQVKEYMVLVKEITQLPIKGFICYIEKNSIIEVAP